MGGTASVPEAPPSITDHKETLLTTARAQKRVSSKEWEGLQKVWKQISGHSDVNAGNVDMNDPALIMVLGSIFSTDHQSNLIEMIADEKISVYEVEKMSETSKDIAKRVVDLFGFIFDVDDDGKLSWQEFVSGVVILTAGSVDEKAEAIFRAIDRDGDGALSLPEISAFARSAMKGVKGSLRASQNTLRMSMAGLEIDDTWTDEDEKKLFNEIAKVFLEADKNHDLKLSYKEYLDYVHRHKGQSLLLIPEFIWKE